MARTSSLAWKSQPIRSFRDLQVYQAALRLQQAIFELTRFFPREERYALTDQIRRSSRSVGANIAEAWQKRRYEGHFVSKLTDADAEQAEVQHWLETALACGYIQEPDYFELLESAQSIGRMLGSMMSSPQKFCPAKP